MQNQRRRNQRNDYYYRTNGAVPPAQQRQRTRRQELLLFLGLVGLLAAWFLTPLSDWIVGVVLLSVPVEADIELGLQALVDIKKQYRQVPDRWGVQQIGWELVQSVPQNNFIDDWSFGVVHADFVNAFALPGGIICVTDKLLKQLKLSDAELAALLGHEMGHVLHRHAQARMIEQHLIKTLLEALFYEDHDDDRETFGEAVGELLLKSAAWMGKQKFSRRDEYQADEASWKILVASNKYDPRSLESLLAKLWSLEGGTGETTWESTHPGTKDRIEALKIKWDELPKSQQRRLAQYPMH